MRIYFIFVILIHASKTTCSNLKYCGPDEIFQTKEDSTCRIFYIDNSTDPYDVKTKDWIDRYLTGSFDENSTTHVIKLITCTNLVRKKDLINVSYVHLFNEKHDKNLTRPLMTVRKCCPLGQRYDPEIRECVNSSSDNVDVFNVLRTFLDKTIDSLSILQGSPTCHYSLIDQVVNTVNDHFIFYNNTHQGLTFSKAGKNQLSVTENNACFDLGPTSNTLVVRTCGDREFCERNTCLRKCCPEYHARIRGKCQKLSLFPTYQQRFHTEVELLVNKNRNNATLSDVLKSADYSIITGSITCNGSEKAFPVNASKMWYLTSSGFVHVLEQGVPRHQDEYCLEMLFGKNSKGKLYPVMCESKHIKKQNPIPSRVLIKIVLEMISCMFLLLTFLVYLSLPSLKNLHGMTLMCHVGSLLLAYLCHAIIIILTVYYNNYVDYYLVDSPECVSLGYLLTGSFLAAFSWLNVMCFDIWWTFRGYNGVVYIKRESIGRKKRFLLYSLYAWGLSIFSSLLIYILDSKNILTDDWRPHLGEQTCWLGDQNNSLGKVIYFYGPLSILLLLNIIFFISTLRNCNRVKRNISKFTTLSRDQEFKATMAKVRLTFRLFTIMGITWIFEVIGFYTKTYGTNSNLNEIFFTIFDVINSLHGVSIFVLFVVKINIYQELVKKFTRVRSIPRSNYLKNIFKNSRSVNSRSILITSVPS